LQLSVAEEATRQWWREHYEIEVLCAQTRAVVEKAGAVLGCEVVWIRAA
jgi:hypothetical protein